MKYLRKLMSRTSGYPFILRVFVLIGVLCAVVAGGGGLYYYQYQKDKIVDAMLRELTTISNFKRQQIIAWHRFYMEDSTFLLEGSFIAQKVGELIGDPESVSLRREIREWLDSHRRLYHYSRIAVLDAAGRILVNGSPKECAMTEELRRYVRDCVERRRIVGSDFGFCETEGTIQLNIFVPMRRSTREGGSPAAILLLTIDPYESLYPLIQLWPMPSRTAETLLVKQDGDDVLFLNELRHRKDTALRLRIPLTREDLPAAMVAKGFNGMVRGRDYRDVPVVAVVSQIPQSDWSLVTKIDVDELYAPVRKTALTVAVIVALVVVIVAAIVGYMWNRKRSIYYRRLYEAESDRRTLARRYELLMKSANDIIITMDETGRIREANDRAVSSYGFHGDDILAMSMEDIQVDGVGEMIVSCWDESKRDGGPVFESEHRRKDGTMFPVEISARHVAIGGEIFCLLIIRDITERKDAERKIREYSRNLEIEVKRRTGDLNMALRETEAAREKLDGILRSVADGLIVTDNDDRIVLMNRAAEDLLGVRFSEAMNRLVDTVITDGTMRTAVEESLDRKGTGHHIDVELPERDTGRFRIVRARSSTIQAEDGTNVGIVTIMNDVTHEREVDRMKTEFVTTAAHELRTPLTSIRGFAELLVSRGDLSEEERKRFLSHIHNQSVHLAALIDDLLDISRIESGEGHRIDREPVDLCDIVRDAVAPFRERHRDRKVTMHLPEQRIDVMADREKMMQVITNILGNADKFSPTGSPIDIECTDKKNRYEVSISDEGIGMTPEQVDRIFDRFYRADMSDKAPGGTGLGMTIVKYIIEAHGGSVLVESELGKGTTVRFTVPMERWGEESDSDMS